VLELPVVSEGKPKRDKKPDWLRVKLPIGEDYKRVRSLVDEYKLNTISPLSIEMSSKIEELRYGTKQYVLSKKVVLQQP